MKKLIFILITMGTFISCSKKEVDPQVSPTIDVNFYPPSAFTEGYSPHVTLKNEEVQVTGFGYTADGNMYGIDKLYISDIQSASEWIVLVGPNRKPEFMYGYNSTTQEKLPYLYWIEYQADNQYVLRYYAYDWENRLGTLLYEANINNGEVELNFENEGSPAGGRLEKSTKSYPVRIPGLNRNRATIARKMMKDETFDEMFDREFNELIDLLQETKTKLINAPCQVSEALNRIDQGLVCDLSDAINQITDEKLFDDFSRAAEENQSGDDAAVFEGDNIKIDIDFFDDITIVDDIRRHLNDVRNNISDSFQNLQDWYNELNDNTTVSTEDLNDLSDSEGVIQVGLSWNTTADIDLHVEDPFGEKINFTNTSSQSGGYLDRDDTDGFGPENVYWTENIPDGTYTVSIVYYGPSGGSVTDYTVRVINGLGADESYSGTVGYFNHTPVHIVTITKSGKNLSFDY